MKKRAMVWLFVWAICAFPAVGYSRVHEDKGTLQATPLKYYFKEIAPDEPAKYTVELKNTSRRATIEIVDIKRSCACTAFVLSGTSVKAGESASMAMTIDFGDELGSHWVELSVVWKYEGDPHPNVTKIFSGANTVALIESSMPRVDFGSVDNDSDEVRQEIRLKRGEANVPWDELSFGTDSSVVSISPKRLDPDHYKVVIGLKANELPVGQFCSSVDVRFANHGKVIESGFRIPVQGDIVSSMAVRPSVLMLGGFKEGDLFEREIRISGVDKNAKIGNARAESTDPEFINPVFDRIEGNEIVFKCRGKATVNQWNTVDPSAQGGKSGKLLLSIDSNGKSRKFSVSYVGFVEPNQ